MTNEEAIKIIKECKEKGFKHTFYTLNEYHDAIDMAIKALEQTELKPSYNSIKIELDAISRQAVLDAFWKLNVELRPNAIDAILNMVNDLPSVSTEKTGRWILTQRKKFIDINCSECGNTRIKGYAYGYTIDELNLDELNELNDFLAKTRMNYCECCGAKMQEVEE